MVGEIGRSHIRSSLEIECHVDSGVPMRAELIEDPDEVARVYEALIQRIGVEKAKATKIGLQVIGDQMPTHVQIRGAIAGRRTVVRLRPG